jgi:flagellar biosynthetic protein FlhB
VIAQGALVVAPDRLVPKASRVSPLALLKQKLGPEGLVEWAKSLLKLGVYAVLLGLTLYDATPRLLQTAAEAPGIAVTVTLEILVSLLGQVFLVALALGAADLVWQRLRHRRGQMMSRQEVTDEMRDSEGDPHMKHQRRQRGLSLAMNQMLADVPTASVVIVNPTHYAVALRWDPQGGRAPTCVAKGVDEIAARIREAAAEAGVPIRSDPPTARALYANTAIGSEVARDDWRAVAAAIRFAEAMRRKAKR